MRYLFRLYQNALHRSPYLTQAVQTGALMGAGDVIAQTLIENKQIKEINMKRTLQFSSIGFFVGAVYMFGNSFKYISLSLTYVGFIATTGNFIITRRLMGENGDWIKGIATPFLGVDMLCIPRVLPVGPALRMWYGILNNYIGTGGKIVAVKKVLVDQLIFAPTFLAILLTTVATMQGKSIEMIKLDLQSNYPDVLVSNYYVWPWVQLVNFYFVPLQYQVLLVQVVAVFWNTYISWKTNKQFTTKLLE